MKNQSAVALGKMGKGIKKTLTEAAIQQRKLAALKSADARRKPAIIAPDEYNK